MFPFREREIYQFGQWNQSRGPQIYDGYFAVDLADMISPIAQSFKNKKFDLVIISQALGPGSSDLSLAVFSTAIECALERCYIVAILDERNMTGQGVTDKTESALWTKFVDNLVTAEVGSEV